jgi:hypothetical protein
VRLLKLFAKLKRRNERRAVGDIFEANSRAKELHSPTKMDLRKESNSIN